MNKNSILFSLSFFPMATGFCDTGATRIPEGKITDYQDVRQDITPSAGPKVLDGYNLSLMADYLFWTATEDNLQFASTGYTNDKNFSVSSGSAKNVNFQYASGFRAGIGYAFDRDGWDTSAAYTWFLSNDNRKSVSADYEDGLTPSFEPYISLDSSDYFDSAKSRWSLRFNTVDWELGRNCQIAKYLALRPFLGLKGSWQTQRFANRYKGVISSDTFSYHNTSKFSFWGAGIRTGFTSDWHLSPSWSFYGNLALSALWSTWNIHRNDSYTIASESKIEPVRETNSINTLVPVLELALGIRKEAWVYEDRLHIALQAGWEEQIWWGQNNLPLNLGIARGGNLYLQGLTARIRFDF